MFNSTHNTDLWLDWLQQLIYVGKPHRPRGFLCYAIYDKQLVFDPNQPIIMPVGRKLSYRFMFAEAHWILSGDNRVSTISPYNKNISQFSDDGRTYFGAYGTKIVDQLPYVIRNLAGDQDSRQAIITIWRESPPKRKDIPCTIMVSFRLDDNGSELHSHVVMRSSDIWLGIPYDIFNFSMLMHVVAVSLPQRPRPTTLTYTLLNTHLYHHNLEMAKNLLHNCQTTMNQSAQDHTQPNLSFIRDAQLMKRLERCMDAEKPLKTWLAYQD